MATINVQGGVEQIFNQSVACETPRTVRVVLPFTAVTTWEIDLSYLVQNNFMQAVQSIYVDNGSNANALTLLSDTINQRLIVRPNHQGYFPWMANNLPRLSATAAGGVSYIHFMNVPMPVGVWPTT